VSGPVEISVVIPLYNEAESLPELQRELAECLDRLDRAWEVIYVDDGSRDGSDRAIDELCARDARVRALSLRRNFGKSAALATGFRQVRGELVVTMDADLQDDPAELPRLIAALDGGLDLVSGWKQNRQDPITKTLPSRLFNAVTASVAGVRLHDFNCGFKVYRREVVDAIEVYGELHRFIPALAAEVGASIVEVPVRHHARTRGKSKYGIDRTVRVLLDLLWIRFLMRFLHRPLQAFGGAGFALGLAGFLILAWLAFEKLALGQEIGGRPLLLLGVLLVLIGVQLVATGLLGELLTRVYHEPQGRAQYLLRRTPRPPAKEETEEPRTWARSRS
jgi:glycosyltransferase involved in cell wall biosynthesis